MDFFKISEKVEIYEKSSGKTLWKDRDFTVKNHLWKFGTTLTRDAIQPFKVFDMDNLVQESMQRFYEIENKKGASHKLDPYYFDNLIDGSTIDQNWWIESRKLADKTLTAAFERSWPKVDDSA